MRTTITPHGFSIWLSARDTYKWANRPGWGWPCSTLAGKRVFAAFDENGLCDIAINGRDGDCDAVEFGAMVADHMHGKLPEGHMCWFTHVGQFLSVEDEPNG